MLYTTSQLQTIYPANETVPAEGPKCVPLLLDFTAQASWELDLQLFEARAFISMIQCLFIDMRSAAASMVVTVGGSGQVIEAAAASQGYYPVLVPNPARLVFTCSDNTAIVPVQLINVGISGVIWSV